VNLQSKGTCELQGLTQLSLQLFRKQLIFLMSAGDIEELHVDNFRGRSKKRQLIQDLYVDFGWFVNDYRCLMSHFQGFSCHHKMYGWPHKNNNPNIKFEY